MTDDPFESPVLAIWHGDIRRNYDSILFAGGRFGRDCMERGLFDSNDFPVGELPYGVIFPARF